MRLLVFTTLFPHPGVPHHGIFVLERLRHWIARGHEPGAPGGGEPRSAVVIAPIPFVPKPFARGPYAAYRDVPPEEVREGIRILHPRYLLLPKVSMTIAPLTLALAGIRAARSLLAAGDRFDLVDAHYLYPDAVAAVFVARKLALPLVVTARGTDVNLIPSYRIPRRWLRWMLERANACIAVAEALRRELLPLAPPGLPLLTLGNGVDLDKFHPVARDDARARLSWRPDRRLILSVGHLIERKGHHHVIAALPLLPDDVDLKVVGDGPWRARLVEQAARLGVGHRVELVGRMDHADLHLAYSAADVLALLSAREGWPNVLLESMASGTPVVATRVFGSPEVVRDDAVGLLVDTPEPPVVALALRELLSHPRDRSEVRRYAEHHSWARTVDGMEELFERLLAERAAGVGAGS